MCLCVGKGSLSVCNNVIVGKPQAAFGIAGGACNTPISAYYISLLLRVATIALDMDGGAQWELCSLFQLACLAMLLVNQYVPVR